MTTAEQAFTALPRATVSLQLRSSAAWLLTRAGAIIALLACGVAVAEKPSYTIAAFAGATILVAAGLITRRALLLCVAGFAATVPTGIASGGIIPLPLIDIGWLALVGLGLVTLRSREPSASIKRWNTFYWILTAAVLVAVLRGIIDANPSLEITRGLLLLVPIASFGLGERAIGTRRDALAVGKALTIGIVTFSAIICLLGVIAIPRISSEITTYWQGHARLYFHNSYLLPLGGGALSAAYVGRMRRRPLLLLGIALIAMAAILSVTRQVVALTIAALVIGALVGASRPGSHDRPIRILAVVFAITALAFVAVAYVGTLSQTTNSESPGTRLATRFIGLVENTDATAGGDTGRYESTRLAWRQDKSALPLGGGLGMLFQNPWSTKTYNNSHYFHQQPYVDSLPLAVLGKLGIIGFAAYLLLFWRMGQISHDCFRILRVPSRSRDSDLVLLLGMFATPTLAVLSLFQSFMMNSAILVAIGLLYASANQILTTDAATH